jgi:Putative beta barrel porin-7 (BBP7)
LNRSWRLPIFHNGGIWEPFVGLRWLQLRDIFDVTATNTEGGMNGTGTVAVGDVPTALPGTSFWNTKVDNNMFGPQIGFRAERSTGRFNLEAELRFMAAVNFQSTNLDGELGSDLTSGDTVFNEPLLLPHTSFHSSMFNETFSPVGELRAGVNYVLTNAISVQCEYNTMMGTGVSRASRRVVYTLPAMGIRDGAKNDPFFTQGLSFGITVNR